MAKVQKTPEEIEAAKAAAAERKAAASKAKSDQGLPDSVTLEKPYGYIHDDESRRFWDHGTVVTDADQIADLMDRKAPLVGITHDEE